MGQCLSVIEAYWDEQYLSEMTLETEACLNEETVVQPVEQFEYIFLPLLSP